MRRGNVIARLKRPTPASALEYLLLALIAIQAARLFWALVTPLGAFGDYKAPGESSAPVASRGLGDFDPFFRLEQSGPITITSLNLKLFGVREDQATGRGSAIIALPDGRQSSFAVGEEILPGVTLARVEFDSVTIDNQGRSEQIFLDQSASAPAPEAGSANVQPGPAVSSTGPSEPAPAPSVSSDDPIRFQPRLVNGRLNGIAVSPGGDSAAFRAAGFAPGDVIMKINGESIQSADQIRSLVANAGGAATILVDRGGRTIQMRVRLNQ